jgi:hypothetical protein
METAARLEFAWRVNSYINDYIRLADAKALGLLAAFGALTGVVIRNHGSHLSDVESVTYYASLFSSAVVMVFAGWVVFPRLGGSGPGLIFWKHIRARSEPEYTAAIADSSGDAMLADLTKHTHQIATVAEAKYSALRTAFGAAVAAFPLTILALAVT